MSWGVSNRLKKILGLSEDMNWFGRGGAESGGGTEEETRPMKTPESAFQDVVNADCIVFRNKRIDDKRAVEVFDSQASKATLYNQILRDYNESGNQVRQNAVKEGKMGVIAETRSALDLASQSLKYADLMNRDPRSMSDHDRNTAASVQWLQEAVQHVPTKQEAQDFVRKYDNDLRAQAGTR